MMHTHIMIIFMTIKGCHTLFCIKLIFLIGYTLETSETINLYNGKILTWWNVYYIELTHTPHIYDNLCCINYLISIIQKSVRSLFKHTLLSKFMNEINKQIFSAHKYSLYIQCTTFYIYVHYHCHLCAIKRWHHFPILFP